jgi:hypothetical protein
MEAKALSISIRFEGVAQYIIVLNKLLTLIKLPSKTKLPLILLQNFALKEPSSNESEYFESVGTELPLYEVIRNVEPLKLDNVGMLGIGSRTGIDIWPGIEVFVLLWGEVGFCLPLAVLD